MSDDTRSEAGSRVTAFVVWGAWALLSAAALFLVAHWGRNVPWWDDWKLAPVLIGDKPLTLAWLWEQGNEHRSPLSKLVFWALARLTGGDLRAAMVLSALLLSALAAALLSSLRALTGRWCWPDVVLPVALLNWGHQDNLLWHVELHFVVPIVLFMGALIALLRRSPAWVLLACAATLPLQSGVGLCLSPPLALWLLWESRRTADHGRRRALRLCAALMCVSGAVYLADYPTSPAANPGFMGVGPSLVTAWQCLSTSLGPVGRESWPWSAAFVVLLGLASAGLLLRVMLRHPERRRSASLLLTGLLATTGVALSIGVSRAGLGWNAGFSPRYTTLMFPWLCCAYLAWRLHGDVSGWRRARLVPVALCVALCVALPFNTLLGAREAQQRADVLDAFAADVRAGLSPEDLADRHGSLLCPTRAVLIASLELLRERRLWLYR